MGKQHFLRNDIWLAPDINDCVVVMKYQYTCKICAVQVINSVLLIGSCYLYVCVCVCVCFFKVLSFSVEGLYPSQLIPSYIQVDHNPSEKFDGA